MIQAASCNLQACRRGQVALFPAIWLNESYNVAPFFWSGTNKLDDLTLKQYFRFDLSTDQPKTFAPWSAECTSDLQHTAETSPTMSSHHMLGIRPKMSIDAIATMSIECFLVCPKKQPDFLFGFQPQNRRDTKAEDRLIFTYHTFQPALWLYSPKELRIPDSYTDVLSIYLLTN